MKTKSLSTQEKSPTILCVTSYPPRECGIATYSQDLITALQNKFEKSFALAICALQPKEDILFYPKEVMMVLETNNANSYLVTAKNANENKAIELVVIQHEFGLFKNNETDFLGFLKQLNKPIIIGFHTVLPNPNESLKKQVQDIEAQVAQIIVMTHTSAKILQDDYDIATNKITVIPHGTHLVEHLDKALLKEKYNFTGRKILATFGLLSSGKCIETTINALRLIVKREPDVLFLVIGKTHPTVIKEEGEKYREELQSKIAELHLERNVKFINHYLPLGDLLEYLQLTDVYLFTSKDRNQAVSGTFSYALSCGCPIISTPIPHAREVLENETGIIVEFENPKQVARKVIELLSNETYRTSFAANAIHKLAPTAWENAAIAHALLFEQLLANKLTLEYKFPKVNLNHLKKMTTEFGIIQFAIINQPDLKSGYTLDDNARALVAFCKQFEISKEEADLAYIIIYFNFIKECLHADGYFLNYLDENQKFTKQNKETNLADANGRAIWALGYLISLGNSMPDELLTEARTAMKLALSDILNIHSPRAMAFIIKGVYYSDSRYKAASNILIIKHLADKMVQMYKHEANETWLWFESYLTYGNSILPEAMLCAYLATGNPVYEEIAIVSFHFLLSKIIPDDRIKVISNKGWMHNGQDNHREVIGGEQPIDVAYTIMALSQFYDAFKEENYLTKMKIAFNWFLGQNHLNQIIYNPCTGGCYDGLEDNYINLNQGAESTVSYLMARLTMHRYFEKEYKKGPTAFLLHPDRKLKTIKQYIPSLK